MQKIVATVSLLILGACAISLRPTLSAQEQAGMKILTIQDDPVLESPLQIEVYLHGRKIKSAVPFQADDDWIGDLQIFVTNKTDDEIKFISFTLDFPTTHNGEEMVKRFRINYGKDEVFKIDNDPDVEERKIDKRGSAVITFNTNNPLAFESFKNFKKVAPYDQKIWDHGILSVYAVEFENRAWDRGFDFDKKGGVWEKNKEKEKKLIERIKKAAQTEEESQIGMFKRSFTSSKAQTLCYTVPPPPRTGATRSCSPAAGCSSGICTYFRPSLEIVSVGRKKITTSPTCSGAGCGSCCEPNVPDLGAICSQ